MMHFIPIGTLHDEARQMRAGEISALLDVTYQLVGHRTSKMQQMGLVNKQPSSGDGHVRSNISERALSTYFSK